MSRAKKQATPATSLTDIFRSRISGVKEDLAKRAFNELNKSDTNESPNMIKTDIPPETAKPTKSKTSKYNHYLEFIGSYDAGANFNEGKPGAFCLRTIDNKGHVMTAMIDTYSVCFESFNKQDGGSLEISPRAHEENAANEKRAIDYAKILLTTNAHKDKTANSDVWSLERTNATSGRQTSPGVAPGPFVLKYTGADGIVKIVAAGTHDVCMNVYRRFYYGAQSGYVHSPAYQAREAEHFASPQSDSVYLGQKHQPMNSGYPQGTNIPSWAQPAPFSSPFVDTRRFVHNAAIGTHSRYPTDSSEQVNAFGSKLSAVACLVYVKTELGDINLDLIKDKGDIILQLVKIISGQITEVNSGKDFTTVAPVLKCLYKAFFEVINVNMDEHLRTYIEQELKEVYKSVCDIAELIGQFKVAPIKVRKQSIYYDDKGFTSKIVIEQYEFA